jgi:hypothetical protein
MDASGERNALSDYEPDPPSPAGVTAIFIAALIVTVLALAVVAQWGPIGDWEEGNSPGSVILDVFAVSVAFWVDRRAVTTWRRYRAPGRSAE